MPFVGGSRVPRVAAVLAPQQSVIKLGAFTLTLTTPKMVAEKATGYYWFPGFEIDSNGKTMLNVSLNPDSNAASSYSQREYLGSVFSGPFSFLRDVSGFHGGGGEPLLKKNDGTVIGGTYNLRPVPDDQTPVTTFTCDQITYSNGFATRTVGNNTVTISSIPSGVKPINNPIVRARISWFGDILDLGAGTWISCLECMYNTDTKWTSLCIRSTDGGLNWTVIGEIGGPADTVANTEGFSECTMCVCPNGNILAVMRTGTGVGDPMAFATSSNSGVTWTNPVSMTHPGRKAPQLLKLTNNIIALATGLTGIGFQFSNDSGATWSPTWDLQAYHRAVLPDPRLIDLTNSGYIAMQEVQPNRIGCVYDRYPTGGAAQDPNGNDGSQGPNQIWYCELAVS